jgi:hypothetical protein
MTALMDWIICGSVGGLLTSAVTYRMLTRRFAWGPRDT